MRLRQTQEAFGACRGCHERESGQEKVMRHQLVQSTDVGAEPTWEGGRKARTRKRDRERKREGARGPREREKEWDQSPRCRTRRVSVTERRPWKSEHPPPPQQNGKMRFDLADIPVAHLRSQQQVCQSLQSMGQASFQKLEQAQRQWISCQQHPGINSTQYTGLHKLNVLVSSTSTPIT